MMKHYSLLLSLLKQIREDWQSHGRDWTLPGFRAVAVYRFGSWVSERRQGMIQSILFALYRIMYRFIRNHYGVELRETARVGRRFVVGHQSGIVIHPNAEFGDDCLIRQNVTIGAVNIDRINDGPKLGHRVDVGAGAVIVGKVKIGDDVRIGPNAVVMTDVPAGTTVFAEAPRMIHLAKKQGSGTKSQGAK
jgi:serine O-acetyltransferase